MKAADYVDPAQTSLLDPPRFGDQPRAHTRSSDPDTSHAAAAVVNRTISEACRDVLAAMRLLGPADDERLQTFYDANAEAQGWQPQRCVRKRRKDLVDLGRATYTGRKVKNSVGLDVKEWRAT